MAYFVRPVEQWVNVGRRGDEKGHRNGDFAIQDQTIPASQALAKRRVALEWTILDRDLLRLVFVATFAPHRCPNVAATLFILVVERPASLIFTSIAFTTTGYTSCSTTAIGDIFLTHLTSHVPDVGRCSPQLL